MVDHCILFVDNMPNVVWIWDISKLCLSTVLVQSYTVQGKLFISLIRFKHFFLLRFLFAQELQNIQPFLIESNTVETRIKEPTFLGNSLLKAIFCCFDNPHIRDGEVRVR